MSDNKIYGCGGEQKAEQNQAKIKALKEVAIGLASMAAGGVLYKAGFAIGSSAADGYIGGAASMAGVAVVAGGAMAVAHGTMSFVENSPKLKKALVAGFNNVQKNSNKMHSFVKTKIKSFVNSASQYIADHTKSGVDITNNNGKYTATYVGVDEKGQGKYVQQPMKILKSMLARGGKE